MTRTTLRWLWLGCALWLLCGCEGGWQGFDALQKRQAQIERSQGLFKRYEQGKTLFAQRKYVQAKKLFLALQSKNPDRLDLMYNLGATYLKLGTTAKPKSTTQKQNFEKALRHFQQVLLKGSAQLRQRAHYNLGVLHAHKREVEKAQYHFESAAVLARKTLKKPDADAEANSSLMSQVLRQRNRKRRRLNRTRIFRYETKTLVLSATREYSDPSRDIVLEGTFTHKESGQRLKVKGYPVTDNRWEVRFIPTRSGKWTYNINTLVRPIPGTSRKSIRDTRLHDKGLFRVLPSARPGRVVLAKENEIRLAWKKPKEKLKVKDKKKKQAPKTKTKKLAKKKKKQPKRSGKANDETLIRWQGLFIRGLFSDALRPTKVATTKANPNSKSRKKAKKNNASKDRFAQHLVFLRMLSPTALHVSLPLHQLFQRNKKGHATLNYQRLSRLSQRLKQLRKNPTDRWVYVYELQAPASMKTRAVQTALADLVARLGHTDVVWSLRLVHRTHKENVRKHLLAIDPYKQPIALLRVPKKWLGLPLPQKASPTSKKAKKGTKSKPKPRKRNTRYLIHTAWRQAFGAALQQRIYTPWIVDMPLRRKAKVAPMMQAWWGAFIAGLSSTITLPRPLNEAELKELQDWLQKADESGTLPAHPDDAKTAKTSTSKTKKPGQRPTARRKAAPPKRAKAKPTTRRAGRPSKAQSKTKAKAPLWSRSLLRFLQVRYHWMNFLEKVRFHNYMRPDTVQVRVPDYQAMAKQRRQQAKPLKLKLGAPRPRPQARPAARKAPALQIVPKISPKLSPRISPRLAPGPRTKTPTLRLAPAPSKGSATRSKGQPPLQIVPRPRKPNARPSSRPSTPLVLKPFQPKKPKMIWKLIRVRGFIASNGLTTLFLAPDRKQKTKEAPQIRWKNSRWDLEFVWYNALTGKFLAKKLLSQVTSLALTPPKKTAHVAKVMLQDHPLHGAYTFKVPTSVLPLKNKAALTAPGWVVEVKAPPKARGKAAAAKGKKKDKGFQIALVRGAKGFEARFRPNQMGLWSFKLKHKGKAIKGLWGLDGKIKVVPSRRPAPLQFFNRNPRMLVTGRQPFLFFAQTIDQMLSPSWSKKQWQGTLKALQQKAPGTTVLATRLPTLPWNKKATKATSAPTSSQWSPALGKALQDLDTRLEAIHKAGFHVALILSPKQWTKISRQQSMQRMFYLLDRYATAYPLIFFVDHRNKKTQEAIWLRGLIGMWYQSRYPLPAALRQAMKNPKQRPKRGQPQARPLEVPPMVGAMMGRPGSAKRLQGALKTYPMLWVDVASVDKAAKDFKLLSIKRPIVLTWRPLLKAKSPFVRQIKGKATTDKRALTTWTRFLWRSHLFGFHHSGRAITAALPAPKKGKQAQPSELAPANKVVAVLRGFFQNLNWTTLVPMLRSVSIKSFQGFGAETAGAGRKIPPNHDVVIWVNRTIRQKLALQRNVALKKHRYVWVDPLTGKQPVSPQLLPPRPPKKKADQMTVPFRPAVLYLFQKPPRKNKGNKKQKRRRQNKRNQQLSKRQQVRNRLNRMQEDRKDLLRKMLKKRRSKDLSGKRG